MAEYNFSPEDLEAFQRMMGSAATTGKITVDQLIKLNAALAGTIEKEKARAEAEARQAEKAKNYTSAIQSTMGATQSFGGALTSAERSLSKYGQGLNQLGNAALELGKNFSALGKSAMFGIKAVTMMGEAVLKQTDRISKGFDTIAQVGASAGLTAGQMKAMANEAGLSTYQLETMGRAAAQASEGFVSAGGSVGKGMLNFGKIITNNMQQFRQLGFTLDEVMEMNSTYMKQQANFGVSLNRPLSLLQKTSEAYVKDLVALADLTGQSVKSQQAAMDFAAAQDNFSQEMFNLSLEEQRLRKAGMEKEADAINMRIKNMETFAGGIAGYSNEMKTALLEAVASGGEVTGELQAKLIASGLDPAKYARLLKEGADGARVVAELQKDNAKSVAQYSDVFGKNAAKLGAAGRETNQAFLMDAERRKQASLALNKDTQQQLDESRKGLDAQMKGRDGVMKGVAATEAFERATQQTLDNVVEAFNPFLGDLKTSVMMFTGLFGAVTLASLALEKFAARAGLGGGMPGAEQLPGTATGRAGKLGALGRVGIGLAGTAAVVGGDMLGNAVGGMGGAAISTLGTAGGMAAQGFALGGPLGAAIGGIAGLGLGLFQNRKALTGNTEATQESDELMKKLMEKYDKNTEATNKNTASTVNATQKPAGAQGAPAEPQFNKAELDKLEKVKANLVDARNRARTYDEVQSNQDAINAIDQKIKAQKDLQKKEDELQKEKERKERTEARVKAAESALTTAQNKVEAPAAAPTAAPAAAPTAVAKGKPITAGVIKGVIDAGPGYNVVDTSAGNQRREGARNWRNNNPGNINFGDFAKRMGAVGTDGRFAVFSTLEQGKNAKEQLLFGNTSRYINLSVSDAISRYAPPNENNTNAYIDAVVRTVGDISPSTVMSSLNPGQRKRFLDAITSQEGFREGKVLQARMGGLASGPEGGYPAILHGKEMIAPLKPDSILEKLASTSQSVMQGESSMSISKMESIMRNFTEINNKATSDYIGKLDKVIHILESQHSTQEKLLRVSR